MNNHEIRLFYRAYAYLILPILLLGMGTQANGAELRPYELPSQKANPSYQRQNEAPAQASATTDGFDYAEYARRAATLPAEEKARLISGLKERLNNATQENNYQEVRHYGRLLEMLDKPQ
jgi:hypothetical protein